VTLASGLHSRGDGHLSRLGPQQVGEGDSEPEHDHRQVATRTTTGHGARVACAACAGPGEHGLEHRLHCR